MKDNIQNIIDGYEVLGRIAESPWGEVLKVRPAGLDRVRAMKIADPEHSDRLYHEKKCLEALGDHPNIVDIFDFNANGTRPYVVVDCADGSVRDWMNSENRKHLRAKTALYVTRDVAKALSHAHDKGILHLDIKPENILIFGKSEGVRYGEAKICDFNLAKDAKTLEDEIAVSTAIPDNEMEKITGTINYMAPEQRAGEPCKQSDVYALGITLYEMITGRVPDRNSPKASEFGAPKWVDKIVNKATAERLNERYKSIFDLLNDVNKGLEGELDKSWSDKYIPTVKKIGRAIPSVLKGTPSALGKIGLGILYTATLPFSLGIHALKKADKEDIRGLPSGHLYTGGVVCLLAGVALYGIGLPMYINEMQKSRIREAVKQERPQGRIVCNDFNKIYVIDAKDIDKGADSPRQEIVTPTKDISLMTPSFDEKSLFFIGTQNAEWSVYKLALDEPEKTEKIVSSAILAFTSELTVKHEDGKDVPYVHLGNELWSLDTDKKSLTKSKLSPEKVFANRPIVSPDQKFKLGIDGTNDLEVLFADGRFGDLDIVFNNKRYISVKNMIWLGK